MNELSLKAENYAAEKMNELMAKAIAQAYADGYRDGYCERQQEIPVDLRDNKTEYVDLGLSSGTLWSADYERENGNIMYLPYGRADKYKIPTEEQWKELERECRFEKTTYTNGNLEKVKCIGPNGNMIFFKSTGMITSDSRSKFHDVYMWLKDEAETSYKKALDIWNSSSNIGHQFSGYKLPIRLVR